MCRFVLFMFRLLLLRFGFRHSTVSQEVVILVSASGCSTAVITTVFLRLLLLLFGTLRFLGNISIIDIAVVQWDLIVIIARQSKRFVGDGHGLCGTVTVDCGTALSFVNSHEKQKTQTLW